MRVLILIALVLGLGGLAAGSSMYFGLPGDSDFRPEISPTQLTLIIRSLQLTDDQIRAVQDLHAAHAAELRSAGAAFRAELEDRIDRAEMLGDGVIAQKIFQDAQQWEERKDALENSFLQEMRLLLDAEQEARWSLVQRELRRLEAMPFGRMLGENLDVVSLFESLDLDPNPEMLAVLDEYARDLDPELQARNDFLRTGMVEADETLEKDPKRAKQLFERSRSLRMAVRDMNIRAIERLASVATPDDAARIRTEFRERMASTLGLGQSRTDEMIRAVAALPSLTAEQRTSFREISEAYRASRNGWDEAYVRAVFRAEEHTVPRSLLAALDAENSKPQPEAANDGEDAGWAMLSERSTIDGLRRLWEERIELDRSTRASLRAMLNEAQQEMVVTKRNEVSVSEGELFGTSDYFSL